MRTLIVYYSKTGKTELVAKEIARILDGDIIKVEEIKKRKGFYGFITAGYDARKEKYSEIKPMDFNLDNYDLIFVGTPIWARKPTPAINTFISKADFRDKKVIIFVTMAMQDGKNVIRILTDRIKSKGGKIVNSFAIQTGRVKRERIIEKAEEIGRQYKT